MMDKHTTAAERKRERQRAIVELIAAEPLGTQQEITRALSAKRGIEATQVSVSRDIAELGLVKAAGRYVAGHPGAMASDPLAAFVHEVATAGPHLVIIRCDAGAAPRVGFALDQLAFPGLVGTLAGDDTVFAALASPTDSARLVRQLQARMTPAPSARTWTEPAAASAANPRRP